MTAADPGRTFYPGERSGFPEAVTPGMDQYYYHMAGGSPSAEARHLACGDQCPYEGEHGAMQERLDAVVRLTQAGLTRAEIRPIMEAAEREAGQ